MKNNRKSYISKIFHFILFLVVILITNSWDPSPDAPISNSTTFYGPFTDVQVPVLQILELPLGITLEFDNMKIGKVGQFNYYENFFGMQYSKVCQDAPELMRSLNFSSCSDVFFEHPVVVDTNYHFYLFSTIDNDKYFPLTIKVPRGPDQDLEEISFTKNNIPDIVSIFHTFCYYCDYEPAERKKFFQKLDKIGPEAKTSFIGNFKILDPSQNSNFKCGGPTSIENPKLALLNTGKPILMRSVIKQAMNFKKSSKPLVSLPDNPWICYCPSFNDFYGDCSEANHNSELIFKGIQTLYFLGSVAGFLFLVLFMVIPCQIISFDECLYRTGYSIAQWRRQLRFQSLLSGREKNSKRLSYSFPGYGGYDNSEIDLGSQSQSQDMVIIETQADFDAQERKKQKKQKKSTTTKDTRSKRALSNVSNSSASLSSAKSTSIAASATTPTSSKPPESLSLAAGSIIGAFWKNVLYHGNEEDYLLNLEEGSSEANNYNQSQYNPNLSEISIQTPKNFKFNTKKSKKSKTERWKLLKKLIRTIFNFILDFKLLAVNFLLIYTIGWILYFLLDLPIVYFHLFSEKIGTETLLIASNCFFIFLNSILMYFFQAFFGDQKNYSFKIFDRVKKSKKKLEKKLKKFMAKKKKKGLKGKSKTSKSSKSKKKRNYPGTNKKSLKEDDNENLLFVDINGKSESIGENYSRSPKKSLKSPKKHNLKSLSKPLTKKKKKKSEEITPSMRRKLHRKSFSAFDHFSRNFLGSFLKLFFAFINIFIFSFIAVFSISRTLFLALNQGLIFTILSFFMIFLYAILCLGVIAWFFLSYSTSYFRLQRKMKKKIDKVYGVSIKMRFVAKIKLFFMLFAFFVLSGLFFLNFTFIMLMDTFWDILSFIGFEISTCLLQSCFFVFLFCGWFAIIFVFLQQQQQKSDASGSTSSKSCFFSVLTRLLGRKEEISCFSFLYICCFCCFNKKGSKNDYFKNDADNDEDTQSSYEFEISEVEGFHEMEIQNFGNGKHQSFTVPISIKSKSDSEGDEHDGDSDDEDGIKDKILNSDDDNLENDEVFSSIVEEEEEEDEEEDEEVGKTFSSCSSESESHDDDN